MKSFGSNIVLGTRGSELALAQAALVESALLARWPGLKVDTKIIATKGDEGKLIDPRAGRKGLFTSEIERALLSGDVDLAVHSAKDLPSETSADAEIAAVLARGATDDLLVSKHSSGLAGLREGATVATGSVRRKHQLHWKRPDLVIVDLRGNVPTRLRKLAERDWDAIVLAGAGLDRLGLSPKRSEINFESQIFPVEILSREIFLPAGGQGIIALQIRAEDKRVRTLVDLVNDDETLLCLRAEREFLRLLQVDCNAPVGVLAVVEGAVMKMRAQFFRGESKTPRQGEVEGGRGQGEILAAQLSEQVSGI